MKTISLAAAAFVIAASTVAPALAQNVNANNLVNVNISNVANDLAKNLKVNVQDLIDLGAVQVPIGVAANVCNVQANVLASDNKGDGASCDATTTSQALSQIVQRQLNAG